MSKLADSPPAYCASCFNAPGPDHRFVDFEAAYDGPVIPGTPVPVPVDDLVICEGCLQEAFTILDPQGLKETIASLEETVKALIDDVDAKDKIILGFRSTTNELIDHPVRGFPGKRKLEGVSPEVRELITKARYARAGTSTAPHRPFKGKRVPA